ncbi:hypothetical protein HDU98_004749 [Podochytrium sp. JEL0797]|nr:hypothetical protein HDU98_004749 [Podochytrium sp. JEL0797]
MGSNANPDVIEVSLKVSLSKNPPKELLEGSDAIELVGDASTADCLLQPKSGEFIAAHSTYLLRNPYFAANLSFAEGQHLPFPNLLKIDSPNPTEFRFVLCCIYANCLEFCETSVSESRFFGLLLNAQFFDQRHLLNACAIWFAENWPDVIQADELSCKFIDQATLENMLIEFKASTDVYKLHVILKWASDWDMKDDCSELQKFVESQVNFKNVGWKVWVELFDKFGHSVDVCIPASVVFGLVAKLSLGMPQE